MHDQKAIEYLKTARSKVYKPDLPIIISLLLAFIGQLYIPQIVCFFGLVAFILFYKKLLKAVQTPCPRCEEPFGTDSNFVLGIGPNKCQHCGLEI